MCRIFWTNVLNFRVVFQVLLDYFYHAWCRSKVYRCLRHQSRIHDDSLRTKLINGFNRNIPWLNGRMMLCRVHCARNWYVKVASAHLTNRRVLGNGNTRRVGITWNSISWYVADSPWWHRWPTMRDLRIALWSDHQVEHFLSDWLRGHKRHWCKMHLHEWILW